MTTTIEQYRTETARLGRDAHHAVETLTEVHHGIAASTTTVLVELLTLAIERVRLIGNQLHDLTSPTTPRRHPSTSPKGSDESAPIPAADLGHRIGQ